MLNVVMLQERSNNERSIQSEIPLSAPVMLENDTMGYHSQRQCSADFRTGSITARTVSVSLTPTPAR